MSSSDIKGLIPKWIISYVAPRKPAEWVETLRKACFEYQEKYPDYHTRLEEYVNRYEGTHPLDYEVDDRTIGDVGNTQQNVIGVPGLEAQHATALAASPLQAETETEPIDRCLGAQV